MEFKRIEIKNYRSIRDIAIKFDPKCRILVGINESGKSNILKAMSYLSGEINPTVDDIRTPSTDEPPVSAAYIRFVFELSEEDKKGLYEKLEYSIFNYKKTQNLFVKNNKNLTLKKFCESLNEGLYIISLRNLIKYGSRWGFKDFEFDPKWRAVSKDCPPNYVFETGEGQSYALAEYEYINIKDIEVFKIPEEYVLDPSLDHLTKFVDEEIAKIVEDNLPECVYWEYSENNLLPGKIILNDFINDPSICLPLKHMCRLAKIGDIDKAFKEAMLRKNGVSNLLNRIAEKTTKHIHGIWKEKKDFKIFLNENGPNIDAGVADKFNKYDFSQRSDGFKRLITFLLMISADERNDTLKNNLILIDEPDIGLHIKGVKHLKNELLKIAKSNYVFYSTHSIFMIDKLNIERHLIVEKTDEVTDVSRADHCNIMDEDVLYNSLGYSIFEELEKTNIIFEGWKDKRLFQVAIKTPPDKYSSLEKSFKKIGVCHSNGVRGFSNITTFLELVSRGCLLISDDDGTAIQAQKKYIKEGNYGTWFRYSEVLKTEGIITGEDFIEPSAFKSILKKVEEDNPGLSEFPLENLDAPEGKLHQLDSWLDKYGLERDARKLILIQIKDDIFEKLKASHIKEVYFKFLEGLAKKAKSL